MRKFPTMLLLALLSPLPVYASSNQSQKTASYVSAFTNVVTRRDGQATDATVQTVNIAQQHRQMWRDWKRTRRWPRILNIHKNYSNSINESKWRPKPNATSVVRVSWYFAENAAFNTEVDNNGRRDSFNTSYDFFNGRVAGSYKPRELGRIVRMMSQLPASQRVTNFRDVLMISGRHNGRWIMRMYSRRHMPPAVRRLLQTITPTLMGKYLSPLSQPHSLKR